MREFAGRGDHPSEKKTKKQLPEGMLLRHHEGVSDGGQFSLRKESKGQKCPFEKSTGNPEAGSEAESKTIDKTEPEENTEVSNLKKIRGERQERLRTQWTKYGPAHEGLAKATETASQELVKALGEETTSNPPVQILRDLPSANDDTIFLAPHVFGNLDDPNWKPAIPASSEDAEQLMESYNEGKGNCWIEGKHTKLTRGLHGDGNEFSLVLDHYREHDISLSDPDIWDKYRKNALEYMKEGKYFLDTLTTARFRSINSARDSHAQILMDNAARSETCMGMVDIQEEYRHPSMKGTFSPADNFALPVGEYGPETTERFIKTVIMVKSKIPQATTTESVKQIAGEEKDAIVKHTARGRVSPEEVSPHEKLRYTEEEGVVSIVQALALLTAQKVEGYDNPDDLVKDIVAADLIEELTRTIPMGLLAPMTNMGGYFPGLVQPDEKKKVRLNPSWKAVLKEVREEQIDDYLEDWEKYEAGEDGYVIPDSMALYCPAVKPHGAISMLKGPLTDVFLSQEIAE